MLRYFILIWSAVAMSDMYGQNVIIRPAVMANGASLMNNAAITLKGTVGQSITRTVQLSNLQNQQGFWPAASGVPKVVTSNRDLLLIIQQIKMFPNPASTILQLDFQLSREMSASISIKDVLGREAIQYYNGRFKAGRQTRILDVSTLTPGQYYMYIRSSEGMMAWPIQVWR